MKEIASSDFQFEECEKNYYFMIRLLATAKIFNQLFLKNAFIKKMFKIGLNEDNYMKYKSNK